MPEQSNHLKVDMSPGAITRRLKESAALTMMCWELSKARLIGPVESPEVAEAANRECARLARELAQCQPTRNPKTGDPEV